jgi:hypothetical protein
MSEPAPRYRLAAIPLAAIVGTAGVLGYAALARQDSDDEERLVVAEPSAADAAMTPSASGETSARAPHVASIAPPASASASAPPVSKFCAAILEKNAELTKVAGADPLAPELHGGCFPTANGAWVVRVDAWKKTGEWAGMNEYAGAWTLVHVDRQGDAAVGRPGPAKAYELGAPVDNASIDAIRLFDYDGDGESEILISTHQRGHEDAYYEHAIVATFVGGAVRELTGLPAAYEGFEDVDNDGRPDVIWHPFAYDREGGLGLVHEAGPKFVAHSLLDGRFSTGDAAARAVVEKSCPKPSSDAGVDDVHPEVCALLRGATRAEALAMLEKTCKRPDWDAGDSAWNTPGVCTDFDERESALSTPLPLRLSP